MCVQRLKCMLIFVYKCVNNLYPSYLNSLFHIKDTHYEIRNDFLLIQPRMNTITHGINSIVYHGAKVWNILPMYIKKAQSLNKFKILLKRYKGILCQCSKCKIV